MNSWTGNLYHTEKGLILGEITEYGSKFKAVQDSFFIGWFISESTAKKAVEEAYLYSNSVSTPRMP